MSPRLKIGRASAFIVACVLASLVPLWPRTSSLAKPSETHQTWQNLIEPGWVQVPLNERDRAFVSAQAGPTARFRKGARRLVVRRVAEASRSLHPVSDCLRAVGYEVHRAPTSLAETTGASVWIARRGVETMHIEEWIVDAQGQRFSEVGQWYWQALLGNSQGPWVAYALSWPLES